MVLIPSSHPKIIGIASLVDLILFLLDSVICNIVLFLCSRITLRKIGVLRL